MAIGPDRNGPKSGGVPTAVFTCASVAFLGTCNSAKESKLAVDDASRCELKDPPSHPDSRDDFRQGRVHVVNQGTGGCVLGASTGRSADEELKALPQK